jgi:hypothetical protein
MFKYIISFFVLSFIITSTVFSNDSVDITPPSNDPIKSIITSPLAKSYLNSNVLLEADVSQVKENPETKEVVLLWEISHKDKIIFEDKVSCYKKTDLVRDIDDRENRSCSTKWDISLIVDGIYRINVSDTNGLLDSIVILIDKTEPEISLSYVDLETPTNQDITVTATTNEGTLNSTSHTFKANGSFTFVATDRAGNVAAKTVTITNIDKESPVITLNGNDVVYLYVGEKYEEQFATTNDGSPIKISGDEVNIFIVGTYKVIYTSTDKAGNEAIAKTRTVNVVNSSSRRSLSSSGSFVRPITPIQNIVVPPVTGEVLGAESYFFTLPLKLGSSGTEVVELQKFLNLKGYNSGLADGKFGPKTKASVIRLQLANNLVGDGIVGPLTRAVLNK